MEHFNFSVKFIASRDESVSQFPFTVSVDAENHGEACKVVWERIREEIRRLRNTFDAVNTCEFKTIIDEPETPIYNRAYVDRLFRDGMNDY